jgi:outer membrane protein assembly factor BamB
MRLRTLLLVLSVFPALCWGAQMRQIAIIDIPGPPGFDQAVFARGMLVLAHSAGDTLDIFDPVRRRIVAQVPGMSGPHGLAVDAKRDVVYVANADGKNIAVVSAKDWKQERTIPLELRPFSLALAPDGRRLMIGNWANRSLSVLDLADGDKVSTFDLNGSPAALVFDGTRPALFVSLQDTAEIAIVDTNSLAVVKRFPLTASQPTAIAVDGAARRVYVAVRHAVVSLNADTGQEIGREAAPAGADSLWLEPPTGMLYLASGGGYIDTYSTTGSKLRAIEEIRTEVRGHSVAFDPVRKFVFVPGGREGRSKLLILKQLDLPGPVSSEQLATK